MASSKSIINSKRAHYALHKELPTFSKKGNCASLEIAHLFDPISKGGGEQERIKLAKAFCMNCPIWEECGNYAETTDHHGGVYAGEYHPSKVPSK